MYRQNSVAVIVPAFNEQELIGETLAGIPDYVDRVVVVDDGSTDRTAELVLAWEQRQPKIVLIRHPRNQGVGAALITGYRRAYDEGLDLIAVMAGDNQMDPRELSRLLDPLVADQADYSKGNRLINRSFRRGMSPWRQFGNWLLTILNKISSGYWHIDDPQNGYTAVKRSVFTRIPPETIYPWYGYCNDLLAKLNVHRFRVVDVPIPARYGREQSKIRYGKYIRKLSLLLLRNFIWRLSVQYGGLGARQLSTPLSEQGRDA